MDEIKWYHVFTIILIVAITFIGLFGCTPTFIETFPVGPYENHVETDTRHTWMCVTETKGTLVGTAPYVRKGQKYVVEAYDRNGDRQEDMVLIYSYVGNGGQLHPFPDRYILQEKIGVYEYVDVNGDGRCASIRVVIGNPDKAEPGSPVQPRKQYPKEEVMPGQDGESCDMEEKHDPQHEA